MRTSRRLRKHEEVANASADEVARLNARLAEVEAERATLEAELASNRARKNGGRRDRGGLDCFLDTYRPPVTARTNLLPGERSGKIFSH